MTMRGALIVNSQAPRCQSGGYNTPNPLMDVRSNSSHGCHSSNGSTMTPFHLGPQGNEKLMQQIIKQFEEC